METAGVVVDAHGSMPGRSRPNSSRALRLQRGAVFSELHRGARRAVGAARAPAGVRRPRAGCGGRTWRIRRCQPVEASMKMRSWNGWSRCREPPGPIGEVPSGPPVPSHPLQDALSFSRPRPVGRFADSRPASAHGRARGGHPGFFFVLFGFRGGINLAGDARQLLIRLLLFVERLARV